jgi:hypothetical protein
MWHARTPQDVINVTFDSLANAVGKVTSLAVV